MTRMDKLLFDSHSHIDYEGYSDDERAAVIARVEASPVAFAVDVGFNMESSRQAVIDAGEMSWCFAAVGVHPHDAGTFTDGDLEELRVLAKNPKVVAIGEIGLDYYRDLSPRDAQRDVFRRQIRLALKEGLPVVIHDRDSGGEAIRILEEEGAFSDERKAAFPPNPVTGVPDARVLLHCFSGSAEQALEYIGRGCTISVAGPVTFKNNKKTARVAELIPLAHLLIETDSPYLTPEPMRGKPNEPAYVEYVARKVAELRGISCEELAAATLENAKRFFGIGQDKGTVLLSCSGQDKGTVLLSCSESRTKFCEGDGLILSHTDSRERLSVCDKIRPSPSQKGTSLLCAELIEDGQAVVLGLSGGPDSVCLLLEVLALSESRKKGGGAGNPVVCAHVNHGLRGDESDGDEAYVIDLCRRLGVPAETKRIDAEALAKKNGKTIEEAGRDARYGFFDEVCDRFDNLAGSNEPVLCKGGGADDNAAPPVIAVAHNLDASSRNTKRDRPYPVIAVAHNLDDQLETVFMRIVRGTGTDGLAGIAERRKSPGGYDVVRPLLKVPRKDIEGRLLLYGETARADSSNKDTDYLRNKIRMNIFPRLEEELGAQFRTGLLRLSENAAEDRDYFDSVVAEALQDNGQDNGDVPFCEGDGLILSHTDSRKRLSVCDKIRPSPSQKGTSLLCADALAAAHPAVRHRIIRAVFAELGLRSDIAAVHLAAADRLLETWANGGEASGKRVEFPLDYTFGITGKRAVFRSPDAADPGWKPRRKNGR